MATNTNAYNSRVTDEALEKRFRDTFRSQGGAELVDDLYAQGVIVPVVDFTAAATGQSLAQNLQTAWDFSTGNAVALNNSTNIITNAGFWQIGINALAAGAAGSDDLTIAISDGATSTTVWRMTEFVSASSDALTAVNDEIVVFVRSGDTVSVTSNASTVSLNAWYRQIATLSGDLVNPTGFTAS